MSSLSKYQKFGESLRRIREQHGYSQLQTAQALHLDPATYVYYEMGEAVPDIFILQKLAEFLDVNMEAFL